jgi:hypothetical protein
MTDPVDFGLSDDANARLAALLDDLIVQLRAGELNRRELLVRLSDGIYEIADSDDPDAIDSTTRIEIVRVLEPALVGAGMPSLVPWEF